MHGVLRQRPVDSKRRPWPAGLIDRTELGCRLGWRFAAVALVAGTLSAGCGLKGPLALPDKPSNVVIRPAPGSEAAAPVSEPAAERAPPPELPPDSRGNRRD
ncbi:MAG TPA: hypothetical protein VGA44_02385 [Steroidobacteraceae bacterium]